MAKVNDDELYETELELAGEFDEISTAELRGFLISEDYKMPELRITIGDEEDIVDNAFKPESE